MGTIHHHQDTMGSTQHIQMPIVCQHHTVPLIHIHHLTLMRHLNHLRHVRGLPSPASTAARERSVSIVCIYICTSFSLTHVFRFAALATNSLKKVAARTVCASISSACSILSLPKVPLSLHQLSTVQEPAAHLPMARTIVTHQCSMVLMDNL